MADVTLVLKADNTQYVRSINEAQKSTQKLHDTATQGAKREKGILEEIDATLQRLEKAKRKAFTIEEIEKYNKKIAETRMHLQEYEQAGQKAEKTTSTLTQTIGKWALSIGGATAALKLLKDAINQTTVGINFFNQVGAVTKQVLSDITKGLGVNIAHIQKAIEVQRVLNEERLQESIDTNKAKQQYVLYSKAYFEASDRRLTDEQRIKKYDEALAAHNKMVDIEVANIERQSNALKDLIEVQPDEKLVLKFGELQNKLLDLEASRFLGTKRIEGARTGLIQEGIDKELDARKKFGENALKYFQILQDEENEAQAEALKKRLEQEAKFLELSVKLIQDYDKSNIESLKGVDKLRAQRAFGLKQIDEFRTQMQALGTLTAEQEDMFTALGENVQKAFLEGLTKETFSKPETKKIFSDFLDKLLRPGELIKPETVQKKDEFSIWSLIGINIDTPDGQKQMDALKEAKDTIIDTIDEIYEKRVEDAERRRELLDTQISETQQELETEIKLFEDGYASNVAAKKKELAELKKQRALALKQEEEAIRRQRQFDTLTQVSSLVTSSSNLFKSLSPLGPAGIAIAIATIATMFAAFAATKIKAAEATKLAAGGSGTDTGIITGRSHARGGEHFLSQVEVERGEAWGVLNIPATQKFGKVFHHMVSSFNKGQIPVPTSVNSNVMVENSGPNSRLDQVIKEQRKLNSRLTGDSIQDFGNMRVIRKGSTIRTIIK